MEAIASSCPSRAERPQIPECRFKAPDHTYGAEGGHALVSSNALKAMQTLVYLLDEYNRDTLAKVS
ncbi:hypothetical protein ABIE33_006062 [Ensifer sp. 4252]